MNRVLIFLLMNVPLVLLFTSGYAFSYGLYGIGTMAALGGLVINCSIGSID